MEYTSKHECRNGYGYGNGYSISSLDLDRSGSIELDRTYQRGSSEQLHSYFPQYPHAIPSLIIIVLLPSTSSSAIAPLNAVPAQSPVRIYNSLRQAGPERLQREKSKVN